MSFLPQTATGITLNDTDKDPPLLLKYLPRRKKIYKIEINFTKRLWYKFFNSYIWRLSHFPYDTYTNSFLFTILTNWDPETDKSPCFDITSPIYVRLIKRMNIRLLTLLRKFVWDTSNTHPNLNPPTLLSPLQQGMMYSWSFHSSTHSEIHISEPKRTSS